MDFSTIYKLCNIGDSNSNSSSSNSNANSTIIQDCILSLEYVTTDGTHHREYIDFMCDNIKSNSNDYYFVNAVWDKLIHMKLLNNFDSIEVWSDGGPHHFKTRYCQYMWHMISCIYFQGKRITHNFFPSYHGHSICDSHAAVDKQIIKREYISSQQQRMNVGNKTIYWGPNSIRDIQLLIMNKLDNTTVIILDSIDRDPELKPSIAPLDRIKQKHCFVYENHTCIAYDMSIESTTTYPIPFTFKHR